MYLPDGSEFNIYLDSTISSVMEMTGGIFVAAFGTTIRRKPLLYILSSLCVIFPLVTLIVEG